MCTSVCVYLCMHVCVCLHLVGLQEVCTYSLCLWREGCSLGVSGQETVQCDFTVTNLISKPVTAMLRIDRGAQGLPSQNLPV